MFVLDDPYLLGHSIQARLNIVPMYPRLLGQSHGIQWHHTWNQEHAPYPLKILFYSFEIL